MQYLFVWSLFLLGDMGLDDATGRHSIHQYSSRRLRICGRISPGFTKENQQRDVLIVYEVPSVFDSY